MLEVDPYAALQALRPVGRFELTSADFADGEPLPPPLRASGEGAGDRSPQLSWSGFPPGTGSFTVTCYDPDAPSVSGWWHWAVANIPAEVSSLPRGAGEAGGFRLPPGALVLGNETGEHRYVGSSPPAGTGVHRYFFVVTALDVPRLDLDPDATPAVLGARSFRHTLARGILVGTAVHPDDA